MPKQNRAIFSFLKLIFAFFCIVGFAKVAIAEDSEDAGGGGDYLEKISGVPVHGFANMGYADDNSTDLHRRYSKGFYLNNFDLYYAPDLGNRVRFLSEVVFEPDAESQQPTFDAERLQAGYVVSKNLTVWVGRFHTPLGYYVTAYHHGMLLQTAIEKPRFLDFEDHYGILPVHTNGLWLNGSATLGENRLGLMAWIGNADRMVTDGNGFTNLDFNMVNNESNHISVGARINVSAGGILDGLTYGATFLHETIDYEGNGVEANYAPSGTGSLDATPNPNTGLSFFSTDLMLYGVHAVYETHGFEFLNELFMFHDTNLSQPGKPSYNSSAGYSQLAYWINGMIAPYIRYERGCFNNEDLFFFGQYNGLPYIKSAIGFHYNFNDNAAFKTEYANTSFQGSSPSNEGQGFKSIQLDYSIRF